MMKRSEVRYCCWAGLFRSLAVNGLKDVHECELCGCHQARHHRINCLMDGT